MGCDAALTGVPITSLLCCDKVGWVSPHKEVAVVSELVCWVIAVSSDEAL